MAASVIAWDGKPLGEGFVAWGCDGAVPGESDRWLVAAEDGTSQSIARTRVAEFLTLHADREIVCRNAPDVFWALDAQLRANSAAAARNQLRRAVQGGRWIDLEIWQRLVDLAEDGYGARSTPLVTADGEDISTVAAQAVELKSATQRLLEMPGDMLRATGADRLGVSHAVKGAIALAKKPTLLCPLSSGERAEAVVELEERRSGLEERLKGFPNLWKCYQSQDGSIKVVGNWPPYRRQQLRKWLHERWNDLREPHDYPAPAPQHAGEISIRLQDWGRLVRSDEQLMLWAEFENTFHAIKELRSAAVETLPIRYEIMPRLKAVPFGIDLLTRVARLAPTAGKRLLRIQLPDLESRCLAAMCSWWYGQSKLADAANDSGNLNEIVADVLSLDAGREPPRMDIRSESDPTRRQIAASLLFATGLNLGDRASYALLQSAGIICDWSGIREMRQRLVSAFPELDAVECRTSAIFHRRFAYGPVIPEKWREITQQIHVAVNPSTPPSERTSRIRGVQRFHQMEYARSRELMHKFEGNPSAESLAEDLLAEQRRTPSGRLRGRCRLTEATAEFLDLADDVKKTILFALAVEQELPVAVTSDALWVEVRDDGSTSQHHVDAVIQVTGARMLSMPLACEIKVISP